MQKQEQTTQDIITDVAKQLGVVLMTAAVTIGMFDLREHGKTKITLNTQPVFAFAGDHSAIEGTAQRREREESGPHYVSYNVSQRTPSRHGKQ